MRFLIVILAFIAAASALPHGDHQHGTTTAAAAPSPVNGATPNRKGDQNGDHHHGDKNGEQGGKNRNGAQEGENRGRPSPQPTTANSPANANKAPPKAAPTPTPSQNANTGGNNGNGANKGNTGQAASNGIIDPTLVPDFGQTAGLKPDGTGNCKADSGKTIPCQCPPPRDQFIAKLGEFVKAGSFFGKLPAPFPTGNSNADAVTRINTIISALQNFAGKPGVGCPAVSAPNFSVVQKKVESGG